MANKREKKPQWNQILVLIVCGWITPFLHTLLIQWCRTQHARTPTPVPPRHLLKSLKYIQKKSFEIKLAQGKTCNFPSRAVAVWQVLGSHPVSWSNWDSGPKMNWALWSLPRPAAMTAGGGDPLPAERVHCCAHTALGPPHWATEHPSGTRKHPILFLFIFKMQTSGRMPRHSKLGAEVMKN